MESFPRPRGRILVASAWLDLLIRWAFDEQFSRRGLARAGSGFQERNPARWESGVLHDLLHWPGKGGQSRGLAVRAGSQLRAGTATRGFRLTARDKEIVRWIGRLRMVTAAQVGERFGLCRAVTYARLGGMVRLGLIDHARIFHCQPGVYLATRSGLSIADLELPPARIDIRTYAHDVELTSVVVELERELGPERVRTEREMRATDTALGGRPPEEQQFAVPLSGARGQLQLTPAGFPRLHFPDCAVVGASGEADDEVLAIELERTAKGRPRLRRILAAYVGARHIAAVRYYVVDERVRLLVEREVAAQRAHSLIAVRVWSPTHNGRTRLEVAA